jgi:hypothetical protein
MKLVFLLSTLFLFSGCAVFQPQPKQVLSQDEQDFCQAFDAFQESGQITGLQKLLVDFPGSDWSTRAEIIIFYKKQLDQLKVQNEHLRRSQRQQSLDLKYLKQHDQQLKEKTERLDEINKQLTDKIEQLKGLLIQSEKYPQ